MNPGPGVLVALALICLVLLAVASVTRLRCPRCGSADIEDAEWPRLVRCKHCGGTFHC